MKKALITGITGQDGSYLAELLLSKGYEVHGIKRMSSSFNTTRIDHLFDYEMDGNVSFNVHYGDLTDSSGILRIIKKVEPDEIYNLGAMSHVRISFDNPEYTADVDAIGTLRILEALRLLDLTKSCRFYQASTSELYGLTKEFPQNEKTPFYPRSPYAIAKMYAHWITINYREAYNMFACNGILFNHESPVRGETFVTRKITMAVARMAHGLQTELSLGNLDARRDWGHAKDYVEAMWMMLQQDLPEDFVIATGNTTSVRELVEMSFAEVGVSVEWFGERENEVGIISDVDHQDYCFEVGQKIVSVDSKYFRPTEVDLLVGDSSKARERLGWIPKRNLHDLVKEMIQEDMLSMDHQVAKQQIDLIDVDRYE